MVNNSINPVIDVVVEFVTKGRKSFDIALVVVVVPIVNELELDDVNEPVPVTVE